jgi:hypothetical protein
MKFGIKQVFSSIRTGPGFGLLSLILRLAVVAVIITPTLERVDQSRGRGR